MILGCHVKLSESSQKIATIDCQKTYAISCLCKKTGQKHRSSPTDAEVVVNRHDSSTIIAVVIILVSFRLIIRFSFLTIMSIFGTRMLSGFNPLSSGFCLVTYPLALLIRFTELCCWFYSQMSCYLVLWQLPFCEFFCSPTPQVCSIEPLAETLLA